MPDFYKAVIWGTFAQQELNNVLYYRLQGQGGAPFNVGVMTDLATALSYGWANGVCPVLSHDYTFRGVRISVVNQDGDVVSPFTVEHPAQQAGGMAENSDTGAIVAICSFRTIPDANTNGLRVPKRSYLAIGPVTSPKILENGLLQWTSSQRQLIESVVSSTVEADDNGFEPYRLGRPNPDNLAAAGRVVSATIRPYVSFRRSRLIKPTGA